MYKIQDNNILRTFLTAGELIRQADGQFGQFTFLPTTWAQVSQSQPGSLRRNLPTEYKEFAAQDYREV